MAPRDILTSLLRGSGELSFPHMELLARDHEPPIVVGEGVFRAVSATEFAYEIHGHPPDLGHTLKAVNRIREDSYDGLNRFRLEMRDADGVQWSGGWTIPEINTDVTPWRFSGTCEQLGVEVETGTASVVSEALFIIPREYSASLILDRFLPRRVGEAVAPEPHVVEVLGVPVSLAHDHVAGTLTISAPFSAPFLPPHAENWFGEPLRILFGQLVYPRLFGRHFPGGRSRLTLRPSPRWSTDSLWLSLWIGEDRLTNAAGFFRLYAGLLALVAQAGEFESHAVTTYYEQAIQASRGSRWVLAMTIASSIEGLLRLLVPRGSMRPDADPEALQRLRDHIDAWVGPVRIKDAARSRVTSLDEMSVQRALFDLVATGVGTRDGVNAWISVRNRVMHGELVSPYSTAEDDQILVNLADLMRALTLEAVRRSQAS